MHKFLIWQKSLIKGIDYLQNYYCLEKQMSSKKGRFHYPINISSSPDKDFQERREHQQIINKLSKEHLYQNQLKSNYKKQLDSEPRVYTPIRSLKVLEGNKDQEKNLQLRSIILNQPITPPIAHSSKKREERQNSNDAYRIIKNSHIVKDEEISELERQQKKIAAGVIYNSPLKEVKDSSDRQKDIKFKYYQVSNGKVNPISQINNSPYILKDFERERKVTQFNPQTKMYKNSYTPQKQSQSQVKRKNDPYRKQEKQNVYKIQHKPNAIDEKKLSPTKGIIRQKSYGVINYHPTKNVEIKQVHKRSCYDYVSEDLRNKLSRKDDFHY